MTPWSAHYYTHPDSYYPVEPSATVRFFLVEIPKPVGQRLSRNDEQSLYETQTLLNPLDLQFVLPRTQRSVPEESAERPEGESDEQPVEVLTCTDQRDEYSNRESGDSESDQDCADDTSGLNVVMSARAAIQGLEYNDWRVVQYTRTIEWLKFSVPNKRAVQTKWRRYRSHP